MPENMNSKYIVFAIAISFVLSSVPLASATVGTFTPAASVATSGPLITNVIYSEPSNAVAAVEAGSIQAPEVTFTATDYLSIMSTCSSCLGGYTAQYSFYGVALNALKYPMSSVNFRRAIEFLTDFGAFQLAIGSQGTADPTPLPCSNYGSACNPMCTVSNPTCYQTATEAIGEHDAGLELLQAGLTCTSCAGNVFTSSTSWFYPAGMGGGALSLNFYYRNDANAHFRDIFAQAIIGEANTIGLALNGKGSSSSTVTSNCFDPLAEEVTSTPTGAPNLYNYPNAVINNTQIAATSCDLTTYGWIGGPAFMGNMQDYNGQYAGSYDQSNYMDYYVGPCGTPTQTPGCVGSVAAVSTPADPVAGTPSFLHKGIYNLDYTTQQIFLAQNITSALEWAQNAALAFSLQLPEEAGYFLNAHYADNANGWTGFAQVANYGPNEMSGLYYTLLNVHQCGSSTCTLGATNGGTLGGTFKFGLSGDIIPGSLNPAYYPNWVFSADVIGEVYDSPLATPPAQENVVNAYMNWMTSSNQISSFASAVTGTGASWYYFQQPCNANPAKVPLCAGKAFSKPGPLQKGAGLTALQRTITNGQIITLTFLKNVYFTDGVQVTAKDYVFSLDYLNIAGSPNYPDSASPFSGTMPGSTGLIAAHYVNAYTLQLYVGSQSFWNLGNIVGWYTMPSTLWAYVNTDHASTLALGTVDPSQPFSSLTTYQTSGAVASPLLGSAHDWMYYLPNMMVGSGPFYLSTWSTNVGTGEITANPSYFNPNWQAMAAVNTVSGEYSVSTPLTLEIYNPTGTPITCGPSTPTAISPGTTGMCQLMGNMGHVTWAAVGAKVTVTNAAGTVVRTAKLTKDTTSGLYTFNIPLGLAKKTGASCTTPSLTCYALTSGTAYKVVLSTTYTFHGQARTWYQVFAFTAS